MTSELLTGIMAAASVCGFFFGGGVLGRRKAELKRQAVRDNRVDRAVESVETLAPIVAQIQAELSPNSGKSVKDAVDRTEDLIRAHIADEAEARKHILAELDKKSNKRTRRVAGPNS